MRRCKGTLINAILASGGSFFNGPLPSEPRTQRSGVSDAKSRDRKGAILPAAPLRSRLSTRCAASGARIGRYPSRSAQGMLQRFPRAVLRRASDALLNEVHTINAVGDIWVKTMGIVELLAAGACDHVLICRRVNVGKRFEERFGMPAGNARRAAGQIAQIRSAGARVNLVRLAVNAQQHLVWLLLVPFESPLGAVDFDPQIIFTAVGNLRSGDGAESAVVVADNGGPIIVECSPRLENF